MNLTPFDNRFTLPFRQENSPDSGPIWPSCTHKIDTLYAQNLCKRNTKVEKTEKAKKNSVSLDQFNNSLSSKIDQTAYPIFFQLLSNKEEGVTFSKNLILNPQQLNELNGFFQKCVNKIIDLSPTYFQKSGHLLYNLDAKWENYPMYDYRELYNWVSTVLKPTLKKIGLSLEEYGKTRDYQKYCQTALSAEALIVVVTPELIQAVNQPCNDDEDNMVMKNSWWYFINRKQFPNMKTYILNINNTPCPALSGYQNYNINCLKGKYIQLLKMSGAILGINHEHLKRVINVFNTFWIEFQRGENRPKRLPFHKL